jgi:hypothetical protein
VAAATALSSIGGESFGAAGAGAGAGADAVVSAGAGTGAAGVAGVTGEGATGSGVLAPHARTDMEKRSALAVRSLRGIRRP